MNEFFAMNDNLLQGFEVDCFTKLFSKPKAAKDKITYKKVAKVQMYHFHLFCTLFHFSIKYI